MFESHHPDQVLRYHSYMPMATREAQREYQRRWLAERRATWFRNRVCIDCGTADGLELDHIDPRQKVTHKVWSWSAVRRNVELAKCVARCEKCHAKKSGREVARGERHGRSLASTEQVLEIRRRVAAGEKQTEVGLSMGLTRGYVNDIIRGRSRRYEVLQ